MKKEGDACRSSETIHHHSFARGFTAACTTISISHLSSPSLACVCGSNASPIFSAQATEAPDAAH